MRRNCSLAPRQLFAALLALGALAVAVASVLWTLGAPFALPFAGVELLGLTIAALAYARHAVDREQVSIEDGVLRVESVCGSAIRRAELDARRTRVAGPGESSTLIELSDGRARIALGRLVRVDARRALAVELRAAIARASATAAGHAGPQYDPVPQSR